MTSSLLDVSAGRTGAGPRTIVVVEDERKIADLLRDYLEREDFRVVIEGRGDKAVQTILREAPVFVILDLMLPGKDGLSITREVRQSSAVPIMMLTAKVDEIDRLLGLEIGADDYLCKPFSPREVIARVNAILRRTAYLQQPQFEADGDTLCYREVTLHRDRFVCEVTPLNDDGETNIAAITVDLTPVEFRLLSSLLAAPGRVFSRDHLMQKCYTDGRVVSDRTIDSHVKNVRRKLQAARLPEPARDASGEDSLIHSIYGIGYKIE